MWGWRWPWQADPTPALRTEVAQLRQALMDARAEVQALRAPAAPAGLGRAAARRGAGRVQIGRIVSPNVIAELQRRANTDG